MTSIPHDDPQSCREAAVTLSCPVDSRLPVNRRGALTSLLGAVLATTAACSASGRDEGVDTLEEPDGAAGTSGATPAPEVERSSPPTRDADIHVLRRLTYGPTGSDIDRLRLTGLDSWLDEQLAPHDLDTSVVDDLVAQAFPQLEQPAADILEEYRADGNGPRLAAALPGAALVRHTQSPAQLHERAVEFWGDHFNVPQVNPPSTISRIVMDRDVFRTHALGRFDDLLIATAQSPAMLLYLDNFRSTAGSINENYARELLELHTVGVDGGYDEDDIVNVARLLTGWGFTRDLEFRFFRQNHDDGAVSILGWDRPAGGDPVDHGVDFLRHLARLPETARHVSRKLATRFVADDPDEELVDAMAAAWIDDGTEVASVIRTMVAHPAFADAPPKFNRPWDYLVQTLRSLDAQVDLTDQRDLRTAYGMVIDLGQTPFRWPSPDGYPDVESAWLNTGSLLARWNLTTQLAASDDRSFPTNLASKNAELSGRPAVEVYDELSELVRHEPVTDDQRALLADLTGWAPDHEPTDDELDEVTPHIAFVLLAGPPTLYR